MVTSNFNAGLSRSVQVRIATREDAENITDIVNSAFRSAEAFFIEGDRIDLEGVLNLLDQGKFLLAETGSSLLGCVYVEPRGDRSYLGLLAIDPSRQRSGLGTALMQAAEDYCRSLGFRFMDIKIVNHRHELPAYYHKRGYVETGTSPFPPDIETKIPCHFIDMSKALSTASSNPSGLA